MSGDRSLSEMEQIVVDDVRERGLHVMPIFFEDGRHPNYMHSIGFWESVDQPEVIVFGLRNDLMAVILTQLHGQCADGLIMADGTRVSNLVEGFDCVLRLIDDPQIVHDQFGWAVWYRALRQRKPMTEAYQVVWPGAQQGLFPWEPGCDQYVKDYQPALYEGQALK